MNFNNNGSYGRSADKEAGIRAAVSGAAFIGTGVVCVLLLNMQATSVVRYAEQNMGRKLNPGEDDMVRDHVITGNPLAALKLVARQINMDRPLKEAANV